MKISCKTYGLLKAICLRCDDLYRRLTFFMAYRGIKIASVVGGDRHQVFGVALTRNLKTYTGDQSFNKILFQLQSAETDSIVIGGIAIVMNLPNRGRIMLVKTHPPIRRRFSNIMQRTSTPTLTSLQQRLSDDYSRSNEEAE